MPVTNLDADIVLLTKAVIGFYDNGDHATGNLFTFDEMQEVENDIIADFEKYYSATGKKRKKVIGDSSTFRIMLKKTSTLYDTADPPTDQKSLSFFQKILLIDRKHVEVAIETVVESESGTDPFIRNQWIGNVEGMKDIRNPDTGAIEVEVTGELLELIQQDRRQAA